MDNLNEQVKNMQEKVDLYDELLKENLSNLSKIETLKLECEQIRYEANSIEHSSKARIRSLELEIEELKQSSHKGNFILMDSHLF